MLKSTSTPASTCIEQGKCIEQGECIEQSGTPGETGLVQHNTEGISQNYHPHKTKE